MNIQKKTVCSYFLSCINPLMGLIIGFFSITKQNSKSIITLISIIVFIYSARVPPLQDLYRRYWDTYLSYNSSTTIYEALTGRVDFLFYANSLFFYKLNIPFYIIPALYSAVSVYLILTTLTSALSRIPDFSSKKRYALSFLTLFSFINIISIALGLRFGLAVALTVRGVGCLYFEQKKVKSIIFLFAACLMHFSMLGIVFCILIASLIKLNKLQVFILSLLFYLLSSFVVPLILSKFNFWGLSRYVLAGYVEGKFSALPGNLNGMIVMIYRYIPMTLFLYFYLRRKTYFPDYENFIGVFLIFCFSLSLSVSAFNRFFAQTGIFFVVVNYFITKQYGIKKSIANQVIIMLVITQMLFNNIYVMRRAILLGDMWYSLILPMPFILTLSTDRFNNYMKEIDSDGEWILNRMEN
ncbi:EpsG family protein [Escherichia coli]|uniref:EpsG family protein n=1 Tax=Escherichia coli TaxID=562 RepID=UPI001BCF2AF3|nr:EpsG family protein [Escherichia coli]MBS9131105.1 EpsG family protein [Escherichia coli]